MISCGQTCKKSRLQLLRNGIYDEFYFSSSPNCFSFFPFSHEVPGVDVEGLRKRKLITEVTVNSVKVTKGPMFGKNETQYTELTKEMLANGDWKKLAYKPVNVNAKGKEADSGHLHPLMKVRAEFREILLELGFEEMPTDR